MKNLGLKKRNICFILFLIACCSLIFNLESLIPSVFADQTVSATIPPRISDFQFDFIAADGQSTVHQGSTMTYQITYGAKQSATTTTNTTITVDWSNDLDPNNSEILTYVDGSATKGYGGAVPVIDVINHTITWTIPSLPQGTTDQKLLFELKTTGYYTLTTNPVEYTINATMYNQYVTLPVQTLTQFYRYQIPGPGPTATPAPQPTAVVTPTPTPEQLQYSNVGFNGISDSGSTIRINTSQPAKITVSYGTSQNNLSQTQTTNSYQYTSEITLKGLKPDTTYYLQFITTDQTGQTATSELFSFKTAKQSTQPVLDNDIIVMSSNGNIFLSNTQKQSSTYNPLVILTVNSNYEIAYTLIKPLPLHSIEAVVLNKILGTTTLAATEEPSEIVAPMRQRATMLYVADLKTPTSGSYEVDVRLADTKGNIIEKKITDLKVIPSLTVYAQDTQLPLQDARVFLYYYDTQTKSYRPITPSLFGPIVNPSYTNAQGQSDIILPPGKYRVEESALLYNKVTADFTIGPEINQNFPVIYLKRDPFNLSSLFIFTRDYLSDTWTKTYEALDNYASSIRLFHLFAVGILGSSVVLSFLLFFLRSHIHPRHFLIFFLFHLDLLFNQHKQRYIYGSITDEENSPLSRVLIEIEDEDTKNILSETITNKAGKFYFQKYYANAVNLIVTKEGFAPSSLSLDRDGTIPDAGLHITLKKGTPHHHSLFSIFLISLEEMMGILFEMSLVITIILELLFFSLFGFAKTTPYLVLSLFNITIWLFYLHERSQKTRI